MIGRRARRIAIGIIAAALSLPPAMALDRWAALDKRVQNQVFQVNVAIKVQLNGGLFAQLADLSPRKHYPVFATTTEDKGFRVVGSGSCFPVKTSRNDRIFFVTNKHVVDFADGMGQECARFFAAMRLHAKRTASFTSADMRYRDLMSVVNLGAKKDITNAQRQMYQSTIDTIWDTYDNHLSTRADPTRNEYKKCLAEIGIKYQSAYFIHIAGPSSIPAIEATTYKVATGRLQPDLALLSSPMVKGIQAMELERQKCTEGQSIQAVGYPTNRSKEQATSVYSPTFSAGRVTRISNGWLEFDASVSKGESGGPVINEQGKVVGVIVRRALPGEARGAEDPNTTGKFATAIDSSVIKAFAPELFARP